jgi:site-specific DNA-methyltransferase (adenine-specific)
VNRALFSSAAPDWETPPDLFAVVQKEWRCTLDVCATRENAKCARYFTPEEDGLRQPWSGVCWMNPPYGREIGKWVRKAYEYGAGGGVVIGLLPARTDTAWFHAWIYGKARITFLKGRVRFLRNGERGPAPFPSMLVVWGKGT